MVLNSILYGYAEQYYLQLNGTRLDPLGINSYPNEEYQQYSSDPDKIRVVFFGDSRAANWPAPQNQVEFEFINRGVGAQTSTQTLLRFDYHIKPLNPKIIIIQTCINDLKTIPIFPTQKENIIANCKQNIQYIIQKSTRLGATVILTTIFPIGEVPIERRLFWSSEVAQAVNDVNAYIHTLKSQDVIVFDTFQILADSNGVTKDEYTQDLLHLNSTGYETLNYDLLQILDKLQ